MRCSQGHLNPTCTNREKVSGEAEPNPRKYLNTSFGLSITLSLLSVFVMVMMKISNLQIFEFTICTLIFCQFSRVSCQTTTLPTDYNNVSLKANVSQL